MRMSIICVVLTVGYLGINQFVLSGARSKGNKLTISAVVLFLYLCMVLATLVLFYFTGHDWMIVYAALLGVFILILVLECCQIYKNWNTINHHAFVLCVLYGLGIVYLTIVIRIGTVPDHVVYTTPLAFFKEAVVHGSFGRMKHFLMNIMMFLPLGILIKRCHRSHRNKCGIALLAGAMLSTMIESIQMLFMLGEADIDDIIANTLGCVVGYTLAKVLRK